jgi:hypothetical protein
VVTSLSPFGDQIVARLARGLEQRHGCLPGSCQLLSSTPDLATRFGQALTEALNIRNAHAGRALMDGRTPYGAPLVLALAAAAELEDLAVLDQLAKLARSEFLRSCLPGTVGLMVYAGPVAGRIPGDAVLAAIQNEALWPFKLAYTDTDARGRRVYEDDAAMAGALFLTYLLEQESIQDWVVTLTQSPDVRSQGGLVTFGLGRVDLAEGTLRQSLRRRIRTQARELLYPVEAGWNAEPTVEEPLDLATLTALHQRANGMLCSVGSTVALAADRSAERWLEARLREATRTTLNALRDLIPPPPPPVIPRMSFWRRLRAWFLGFLRRIWHRFWAWLLRMLGFGHRPIPMHPTPTDTQPNPPTLRSSASCELELAAAERFRFQLALLAAGLQAGSENREQDPTQANPFELALGDLSDMVDLVFGRCVPNRNELAWTLKEAFPPATILDKASTLETLLARFDATCDGILKLNQRSRWLRLEDYRGVLDHVAEVVGPLFCGGGSRPRRRVLLPARLASAYEASGYETHAGAEEEVVFLTLQTGITLQSLFNGEDTVNEPTACRPASVS